LLLREQKTDQSSDLSA